MDYTDCCINLTNHKSKLRLNGKCIFDNHESIWLITVTDQPKLHWIKRCTTDLEITIDEYSEEDYCNLQVSKDWKILIDLLSE